MKVGIQYGQEREMLMTLSGLIGGISSTLTHNLRDKKVLINISH